MTPNLQTTASSPDVLPDDLPHADLSENARIVLARRYLKKDEKGRPVEEPEQMFWRVARVIAQEDAKYGASEGAVDALAREFYRLMTQRLFEPNSPTLMNAGRPLGQLSACFVLPVEDALSNEKNGIYDTLRAMALVHQSGGGTGFAFSPSASGQRRREVDDGSGQRARQFHEAVRCFDGSGEAGRYAARRQHGHPARGSSGHPRFHHLQAGRHADHQLQHFGGRHGCVHGGGQDGGEVRPDQSAERGSRRAGRCTRDLRHHRARRLGNGGAGRVFHRQSEQVQPRSAARALRSDQSRAASSRCCRTMFATWGA